MGSGLVPGHIDHPGKTWAQGSWRSRHAPLGSPCLSVPQQGQLPNPAPSAVSKAPQSLEVTEGSQAIPPPGPHSHLIAPSSHREIPKMLI